MFNLAFLGTSLSTRHSLNSFLQSRSNTMWLFRCSVPKQLAGSGVEISSIQNIQQLTT